MFIAQGWIIFYIAANDVIHFGNIVVSQESKVERAIVSIYSRSNRVSQESKVERALPSIDYKSNLVLQE